MTVAGGTSPQAPLGPAALQPGNRIAPWGDRLREEADAPSLRRTIPCLAPKAPQGLAPAVALGAEGVLDEGSPSPGPFPDPLGAPQSQLCRHTGRRETAPLEGGIAPLTSPSVPGTERERVEAFYKKQ